MTKKSPKQGKQNNTPKEKERETLNCNQIKVLTYKTVGSIICWSTTQELELWPRMVDIPSVAPLEKTDCEFLF